MAVKKMLQGKRIPFRFNASELGIVVGLRAEISQNKIAKYIFLYPYPAEPKANEFELTKDGDVYSGMLTSAMTSTMRGLYSIELTKFDGAEELDKGSSPLVIIEEEVR